jgi:signal recognition particle subunit SRP19
MKKKDEIILWPAYFDSTRARSEGRKISKKIAVEKPRLDEIGKALERMSFKPNIMVDAIYPQTPFQKIGMLSVPKKGPKNQFLKRVAKELCNIRLQSRI